MTRRCSALRLAAASLLCLSPAHRPLARAAGATADANASGGDERPPPPSAVVSLTSSNFDELTRGRTVFIKFFAPWCGHCQELAPVWESLASQWYERHPPDSGSVGLIGEVDCTVDRALCDSYDIEGLPTLLYGDPLTKMDQYGGDRTLRRLKRFAEQNLVPVCSANNPAACDEEGRGEIDRLMALSLGEVERLVREREEEIERAEREFDEGYEDMQARYNELAIQKEIRVAKMKDSLRMMKEARACTLNQAGQATA